MRRPGDPVEFRRKVLDLLDAGESVASIDHDLEISDQTIYGWRRQDRIDRGLQPGLSTAENAELAKAKKRISELETELAISRRATELLKEETSTKGASAAIEVMAAEGKPVQVACKVLGVSGSGFYAHRSRSPSERSVRHSMLTALITQIHVESHGIYGGRRKSMPN